MILDDFDRLLNITTCKRAARVQLPIERGDEGLERAEEKIDGRYTRKVL